MSLYENRQNFKNNFLNKLTFKIEFEGMIDRDLENLIESIRPTLIKKDYNKLIETYTNNIGVNLSDVDNIQTSTDKIKLYVFQSESFKQIRFSKTGIYLDIDMEHNKTLFGNYLPTISTIIDTLKSREFIQFRSIGLEKTNICFLTDVQKLNNYFTHNVFSIFNDNFSSSEARDLIFKDNQTLYFNRWIQKGKINEGEESKDAAQIILHFEARIDEANIDSIIRKSDANYILDELNTSIFEMFDHTLTDEFKSKLSLPVFEDLLIMGVKPNDY